MTYGIAKSIEIQRNKIIPSSILQKNAIKTPHCWGVRLVFLVGFTANIGAVERIDDE